eukprot:m.26595 g.26595  ORF g.26595 m.26595 type:complete len:100 (+) comp5867_c0_seq3:73-372(+)
MMDVWKTVTDIYFVCATNEDHVLRVNRKTAAFAIVSNLPNNDELSYLGTVDAFAGVVSLLDGGYLVLVTESKLVGMYNGEKVGSGYRSGFYCVYYPTSI